MHTLRHVGYVFILKELLVMQVSYNFKCSCLKIFRMHWRSQKMSVMNVEECGSSLDEDLHPNCTFGNEDMEIDESSMSGDSDVNQVVFD